VQQEHATPAAAGDAVTASDKPMPARELRARRGRDVKPTLAQIRRWPATVDVRTAASAFGISPSHAYELINRSEFPAKVIFMEPGGGSSRPRLSKLSPAPRPTCDRPDLNVSPDGTAQSVGAWGLSEVKVGAVHGGGDPERGCEAVGDRLRDE
jgi:hypothetical protein